MLGGCQYHQKRVFYQNGVISWIYQSNTCVFSVHPALAKHSLRPWLNIWVIRSSVCRIFLLTWYHFHFDDFSASGKLAENTKSANIESKPDPSIIAQSLVCVECNCTMFLKIGPTQLVQKPNFAYFPLPEGFFSIFPLKVTQNHSQSYPLT